MTPSSLSLEVESSPALTGSKGRSKGQAPLAGEVPLCRVGPVHQGRARARQLQVLGKCVLVDLGPGGGGLGGGEGKMRVTRHLGQVASGHSAQRTGSRVRRGCESWAYSPANYTWATHFTFF